ncbi:MAG TPA: hypothetical protein VK348_01950, partial [Planctomycetota bacterium]|nr:hypothetical protein [Planctomycetota bacterium]
DRDIVLAARVTGPAVAPPPAADKDKKDEPKPGEVQAAANKQVKLVVVADLDAFSNMFFNLRRANQDDNLRFDNVAFILDCIDDLVGDQSLIELRNRRPKLRQLTTVMQSQEQYEKTWSIERKKAEDDARKALDAAQARLDAAVKKIDDSADLDERAKEIQKESVQQTENRKLELEKGTIENEKKLTIERARYAKNAQQRQVQTRYQISTLVFTPVPALLVGLWIFFRRRSREALIVPKNRMVSGGVQ